jgi:hypothetical protein
MKRKPASHLSDPTPQLIADRREQSPRGFSLVKSARGVTRVEMDLQFAGRALYNFFLFRTSSFNSIIQAEEKTLGTQGHCRSSPACFLSILSILFCLIRLTSCQAVGYGVFTPCTRTTRSDFISDLIRIAPSPSLIHNSAAVGQGLLCLGRRH